MYANIFGFFRQGHSIFRVVSPSLMNLFYRCIGYFCLYYTYSLHSDPSTRGFISLWSYVYGYLVGPVGTLHFHLYRTVWVFQRWNYQVRSLLVWTHFMSIVWFLVDLVNCSACFSLYGPWLHLCHKSTFLSCIFFLGSMWLENFQVGPCILCLKF